MTQTTLTGQDIGQAHQATRAVLERRLAEVGLRFPAWVTLNVLGGNGSESAEGDLIAQVVHGLKIEPGAVRGILAELADQGLVTRTVERPEDADPAEGGGSAVGAGLRVALTSSGSARRQQVLAAIAEITARLYGGLPAEELAVAHRMLATVTARANAELVG